jgi:hypothetical protein
MKHRFLFLSILLFCGVALSTLNAKNIEQGKLPDGGYWTLNDDGTELFIHAKKIPDCGVVSHRGGEGDPLGPEKKGEYCFVTDAPYCALAKTVTTIIFSDDIVYIGNNAFRGFSKLVQVTFDKKNYVNESFSYDHTIYDLLSLCYYYKNDKNLALYYINKAIDKSPNIERLKNNKQIFENMEEF